MILPEQSAQSQSSNLGQVLAEERFLALRETIDSQIDQLSPTALAYLGDAVYELFIRTRYLLPPKRISDYHQEVVAQVRAETQARVLRSLLDHLSEAEQDILRRGRNATNKSPRRLSPRIYQQATSFETLIGYLYLKDPQRLQELLSKLNLDAEASVIVNLNEEHG